jgi:hypothetical protein
MRERFCRPPESHRLQTFWRHDADCGSLSSINPAFCLEKISVFFHVRALFQPIPGKILLLLQT